MNLTSYIDISVIGGIGEKLLALFTKVVQFLANIIYTVATFIIDFVTQPEVAGVIVAIMLIGYVMKRRAWKKVI